jgi:hypothetical protein
MESAGFLLHSVILNYVICKGVAVAAVLFIFITEKNPLEAIFIQMVIFKNVVCVLVPYRYAILTVGI